MKQLTERQAWREIARRLERRGCEAGLCHEVFELSYGEQRISYEVQRRMLAEIKEQVAAMGDEAEFFGITGPWLSERGDAGPRIIAATLLAELAAE